VLLEEQRAKTRAAQQSQVAWNDAAVEADLWLDRALDAGGHDGMRYMRRAEPSVAMHVVIRETTAMGVRLPAEVSFAPAPNADPANAADAGGAALICACTAMTRATEAACRAAADLAAARALDAAVSTTRRQIRVLRRHWIPRLHEALAQLDFALEQSDFEDGARRRLAAAAGLTALVTRDAQRDAVIHRDREGRRLP
jgi:V/A-type H+-transporting ATPase subunit D